MESDGQLCFQFPLHNFLLNITETTINSLNNFSVVSGFYTLSLKHVSKLMLTLSDDGLLTKDNFDKGIEKLFASKKMQQADKINCLMILSSIFYSFDRTGNDVVDVIELICGLSVLCEGSKSSKLAFAFDLFDEDEQRKLSKRGLWRYFRSFIASLLTISGASLDLTTDAMTAICDDCAVWTTSMLLKSLKKTDSNYCTFENIADWYTTGGYQIATWLELLDLSKWLPLELPTTRSSNHQPLPEKSSSPARYDDKIAPENPFVDSNGIEIFRAELFKGNKLSIMESDTNFVLEIAQLTLFLNLEPSAMIQNLSQFSRDGRVSIHDYNKFIRYAVPRNMDEINLSKISYALSSIYFSYDDNGANETSFHELASGLSVLCRGTKSHKLSTCFSLFDSDGDGFLYKHELISFLSAFLRFLLGCAFSSASTRKFGTTTYIVTNACETIANVLFNNDVVNKVDFQYFGDWYNEGGFRIVPWLELIDLSKWIRITNSVQSQAVNAKPNSKYNRAASDDGMMATSNVTTLARTGSMIESPKTLKNKMNDKYVSTTDPYHIESKKLSLDNTFNNNKKIVGKNGIFDDEMNEDNDSEEDNFYSNKAIANNGDSDSDDNIIFNANESSGDESSTNSQGRVHDESGNFDGETSFTLSLQYRNNLFHTISITSSTIYRVTALSVNSGLINLLAEDVNSTFLDMGSDHDGLISSNQFKHFIERVKPDRRRQYQQSLLNDKSSNALNRLPPSPIKDRNLEIFQELFNAFDRTKSGVVDSREIACGLCILCDGSKSSKLAEAFDLLDSDNDGLLSRRGLWLYFRSFLCSLLILSHNQLYSTGRQSESSITFNDITRIADGSALLAADSVLSGLPDNELKVSFDDIADWYTSTGFRVAPWLELLDMSKWRHLIRDE